MSAGGSLLMKPTVSDTSRAPPPGSAMRRVVGSSVANGWSATSTVAPARAFSSVDFPTFV